MVARLFRLRVALLLSVFRGGMRNTVRAVSTGLGATIFAVLYAWAPQWLAHGNAGRTHIDVFLATLMLALVAFVPFFTNITHFEPRQFGTVPATSRSIATAMLLSSVVSWPAAWLVVWMVATFIFRPEWKLVPWATLLAAVLTLSFAVLLARISSGLVRLWVPSQATSLLRWAGLLLVVPALPAVIFLLTDAFRSPQSASIRSAASVFGWTPFGAPSSALAFAEQGNITASLIHFAFSFASLAALLVLWYWVVGRSLTSISRPVPAGISKHGLEFFDRVPAKPGAVIAARALTYWRRDPRYKTALLAIPLAPIVMVAALWVAGMSPHTLALLPLPVILLLLGWSVHNDVALDSTAIWLHVASGTKGVRDRLGRIAPVLLIGVPLIVVGSSLTVTISGDWRILPAVIGMNFAVLFVSAASSSVFSALMPYPATRPGDSPFAQPAIQGSGAGLAQSLSMLTALLLSLPPVVFAVFAVIESTFLLNMAALLFGVIWGAAVLATGVMLGGKIFDQGAPELVALTQTFD